MTLDERIAEFQRRFFVSRLGGDHVGAQHDAAEFIRETWNLALAEAEKAVKNVNAFDDKNGRILDGAKALILNDLRSLRGDSSIGEKECCGEWTSKDSYDCDRDGARTKPGTCSCTCHGESSTG